MRARRKDNGMWIEGDTFFSPTEQGLIVGIKEKNPITDILGQSEAIIEVDAYTLCESTIYLDATKRRIHEGDIVWFPNGNVGLVAIDYTQEANPTKILFRDQDIPVVEHEPNILVTGIIISSRFSDTVPWPKSVVIAEFMRYADTRLGREMLLSR